MFLGHSLTFLINYYFLSFFHWKNLTNALRVLIYKLFLEIEKTNVTKLFLQFFIFFIKIELNLSCLLTNNLITPPGPNLVYQNTHTCTCFNPNTYPPQLLATKDYFSTISSILLKNNTKINTKNLIVSVKIDEYYYNRQNERME